ncbi:protein-glutamine gamma-glutamyltransferase E-like [Poecilia latipinna]|uniref:protein-glutamine gamma-glutamyltransferase E-like n=1 Tax=Poecilia latipinna TaxID=48699 RepID=UPI00072E44D1|nr:PREDICTED: protein-glutamine gamma-glutamyltransferase E-like [Poecilia latipinna]
MFSVSNDLSSSDGLSDSSGFLRSSRFSSSTGFSSSNKWINNHAYSAFKEVDLHCETNNNDHHTSQISVNQLIVRRGQPFNITLKMAKPFNPDSDQLTMKVVTGKYPSEERGTMSRFGVPDKVELSPCAIAVWKAELQKNSLPETGMLALTITPPAHAPVGEYKLSAGLKAEENELAELFVLFNPWCSEDWVFLPNEAERQEYVMNQHGIIYKGSDQYIHGLSWDFGQFEEDMVQICLKLLDLSRKHKRDPADDVSARCNPIYVGRVVTNMVNKEDANDGVLVGNWSDDYSRGFPPTHWSGSYDILKQWYTTSFKRVSYGQCWVFAGIMCSVMRLLGIPCRVVTNFQSAHDSNANLTIDKYYGDFLVRPKETDERVWNFHVWVEGWMRRPDLAEDGRYDGWQALDGTPQELSEISAILKGDVHLKYDVLFVSAEVNADVVSWLVKRDGSKVEMFSDTKSVGQHISTKAVGSNERVDITNTYKHTEGSAMERAVFRYALSKLDINNTKPTDGNAAPQLIIKFEEESTPVNGQDVKMKLVLRNEGSSARTLSIGVSVQAMTYTGRLKENIKNEVIEKELLPGNDLTIPIQVPYSSYSKQMVSCQTMNISALITDIQNNQIYVADDRVVLKDPPISLTVPDEARVDQKMTFKVDFKNPVNETLTGCTLTVSGTGLVQSEEIIKVPDLMSYNTLSMKFSLFPYKSGEKTLLVDFDCASFRDIKASCTVNVKP